MRVMKLAAVASLALSAPAEADVGSDIRALEAAWGNAFLTGNHRYLAQLLAPEFKLMRAEGGRVEFTPRARWLANLNRYTFHKYEVRTVDVVVAGKTAVATVQGRWSVSYVGRGTREEGFIVTDTWVRRNGGWQVIYRHSTPSPAP